MLAAIVYSGVVSFILLKVIGLVMPLRATDAEETEGLDISQHGEEAYMHAGGSTMLSATDLAPGAGVSVLKPARGEA